MNFKNIDDLEIRKDILYNGMFIKVYFNLEKKHKTVSIGKMLNQIEGYHNSRDRFGEIIRRFELKNYGTFKFRYIDYKEKTRYLNIGFIFDFKFIGDLDKIVYESKRFLSILHNFTRGYYEKMEFNFYRESPRTMMC